MQCSSSSLRVLQPAHGGDALESEDLFGDPVPIPLARVCALAVLLSFRSLFFLSFFSVVKFSCNVKFSKFREGKRDATASVFLPCFYVKGISKAMWQKEYFLQDSANFPAEQKKCFCPFKKINVCKVDLCPYLGRSWNRLWRFGLRRFNSRGR